MPTTNNTGYTQATIEDVANLIEVLKDNRAEIMALCDEDEKIRFFEELTELEGLYETLKLRAFAPTAQVDSIRSEIRSAVDDVQSELDGMKRTVSILNAVSAGLNAVSALASPQPA